MHKVLHFKAREDWRIWLEKNHDTENHAWLKLYKKRFRERGMTLEEAVEEALCYGWIDGKLKRIDDQQFILRFSSRKANSLWSRINKERAERLMKSGRMTRAGFAKIKEAKESGWWDIAYTNKIKDDIPADLKQALMKDRNAWSNFLNFANSYRNMYISWVNNAKTVETRMKRIEKIVEQSRQNKKLITL